MQLMVRNLRPESHPVKRVAMPSISFIVARSYPGNVIGCENMLPWHIRSDLQRFKKITSGHVVIMGRKTLESIGKPLPNRKNVVLSRTKGDDAPGLYWASTKEDALYMADIFSIINDKKEFFVIGGAEIYKSFFALLDKIYLTEVFAKNVTGDAYFDHDFDHRRWSTLEEEDFPATEFDEYPYRYSVYKRKRRRRRAVDLSQFMTETNQYIEYIKNHTININKIRNDIPEHYDDLIDKYVKDNEVNKNT